MQVKDALQKVTKALPNGAASVTSDALDTQNSTRGNFQARCELLISAPALVVGDLGDGATMKYDVVESANADLSSPTVVAKEVLVQTGAGGAGAAAATARYRIKSDTKRYVGVKATNSAAGDASDKSLTAELVF
jgi:hypothetical protein